MNLIDKDALVAEIKRRIQEHLDAGGATSGVYLSERMKEDSYLLSFIDTLDVSEKIDKEQPIEGLEQEVISYFQGMWPGIDADTTMSFTPSAIMRLVKHFYNFGKKARNPELSEISEKYAEKLDISKGWFDGGEIDDLIKESFQAGAEWQYQKDRREFAKLKAKEWMSGYNEGLSKAKEEEK